MEVPSAPGVVFSVIVYAGRFSIAVHGTMTKEAHGRQCSAVLMVPRDQRYGCRGKKWQEQGAEGSHPEWQTQCRKSKLEMV